VLLLAGLLALRRRAVTHAGLVADQRDQLEEQAIELEEQAAELEQQLSESQSLMSELSDSSAALRRANAELSATSYSIAHDLRSPLRAIDGHSYMLLERYGDTLDDDGRETLRRVRANSQRMGHLIDGLLTLGRLGREPMAREPRVDLSAIARAAIENLRAAEPDRRVEARVADGLVAPGDPRMLATVVQNLVDNAWKFTRQNDGDGRPPARIEVGARAGDGAAPAFYVRDNGAGFDMAFSGQLFRPFQRLHRDDEYAGFGIGLASVQRVVERHGGRVWAEGGVGRGATFYFTLPGADAPRAAMSDD
jgi:light-regulated signal transduction histidine kinase (bacteriophytochrome)